MSASLRNLKRDLTKPEYSGIYPRSSGGDKARDKMLFHRDLQGSVKASKVGKDKLLVLHPLVKRCPLNRLSAVALNNIHELLRGQILGFMRSSAPGNILLHEGAT